MPLSTLPGRGHLRSAVSGQYDVPPVSSLAGSRAFSVAGPRASNQLPVSLRHTDCVATFKRHLKTLLFAAAYGVTDNWPLLILIRNSNYYVAPLFKLTFYVFSATVQFCKGHCDCDCVKEMIGKSVNFEAIPKTSERWSWGDVPKAASSHRKRTIADSRKPSSSGHQLKDDNDLKTGCE